MTPLETRLDVARWRGRGLSGTMWRGPPVSAFIDHLGAGSFESRSDPAEGN